jgi:hypothetical protein
MTTRANAECTIAFGACRVLQRQSDAVVLARTEYSVILELQVWAMTRIRRRGRTLSAAAGVQERQWRLASSIGAGGAGCPRYCKGGGCWTGGRVNVFGRVSARTNRMEQTGIAVCSPPKATVSGSPSAISQLWIVRSGHSTEYCSAVRGARQDIALRFARPRDRSTAAG